MLSHFFSFGAPQRLRMVLSSKGGASRMLTEVALAPSGTKAALFEPETVALENVDGAVTVLSRMTLAGVPAALTITASDPPEAGWQLAGSTQAGQAVPVGKLIEDLSAKFGISVPAPFASFALSNVAFEYATGDESFRLSCQGNFVIASAPVSAVVTITIASEEATPGQMRYQASFGGTIRLGSLQFELKFDRDLAADTFVASYCRTGGASTSIKLNTLLRSISAEMAREVPDDIEIQLKNVKFAYQQDKKTGGKQFALAIDLGVAIDLANLPLVGKQLPPDMSLGLDDLQILYSSGPFSQAQLVPLNALLPAGISRFSAAGLEKGLALSGNFNIAGFQQLLLVGSGAPTAAPPIPRAPAATASDSKDAPLPPLPSTTVKWFDIGKTIGPAHFRRVGVDFNNSQLWLYLDAGISMGGLAISLSELSVGSSIKHFAPSFNLAGLSIDFNKSGLEIGAALLRQESVIDGVATEVYNGTAVIRAEGLSLSAMGSYAYYKGHPSLFIYAYLEKALGGPSFFFVEGLAAGFGYNRALLMPDISQVASFPLVAQVMGGGAPTADLPPSEALQAQLTALSAYVPPSVGDIFFAIGVKFNSFKLIDSFALLVVAFGNRLEIDLLGQSNIVVPLQKAGSKLTPLAEVRIVLLAKYLPDEGFLAVLAQLSPDSYIFSKDCHLTGGAAFYSWFKGEHEGDFVATVGGYHPAFRVPAHYPTVPRLALNWQVSERLSVKGDMYFALCAHAFMAGGHLEAIYEDGDFKAWFRAGADFLVTWQPYHYEARIYVNIGASYTIHFFGSHTISVDLGADLSIWGPEFSGRATVHIYVCDITLHFGAHNSSTAKPISWEDFKLKCLPDLHKILDAGITSGQHNKDEFQRPIVNPKDLELLVNSAIPVKNIKVNGNDNYDGANSPESVFGVSPMDVADSRVKSELRIEIAHNLHKPSAYSPLAQADLDNLLIKPQQKAVPAAIWGTTFQPDLNTENRTLKVVNGVQICAAEPVELPVGGVPFPPLAKIIMEGEPIVLTRQKTSKLLPFSTENSGFKSLCDKLGIAS